MLDHIISSTLKVSIMRKFASLAAISLAILSFGASAQIVNITGQTQTGLGDQNNTQYDIGSFANGSFTYLLDAPVTFSTFTFTTGNNSNADHVEHGTFSLGLAAAFAGVFDTLVLPYMIDISNFDTISFVATQRNYTVGGQTYTLFTDAFSLSDPDFSSPTAQLTGRVSIAQPVPEPEIYALMIAGLGALGFMSRRRKQSI